MRKYILRGTAAQWRAKASEIQTFKPDELLYNFVQQNKLRTFHTLTISTYTGGLSYVFAYQR